RSDARIRRWRPSFSPPDNMDRFAPVGQRQPTIRRISQCCEPWTTKGARASERGLNWDCVIPARAASKSARLSKTYSSTTCDADGPTCPTRRRVDFTRLNSDDRIFSAPQAFMALSASACVPYFRSRCHWQTYMGPPSRLGARYSSLEVTVDVEDSMSQRGASCAPPAVHVVERHVQPPRISFNPSRIC